MEKTKNISVVIPTYNRPNEINKTINNVLQQTFKPYEIIVVDDNSSSKLKLIKNKKIKYIKLKKNLGVASARNIGAKKAQSKFLAFLDDDDKWPKNYLEKIIKENNLIKKKIYLSKINIIRNKKQILYKNPYSKLLLKKLFLYNPGVTGSNIVIDKNLFFKIGGYNKNLYVCEDKGLIIDSILKNQDREIHVQKNNFIIYKKSSNSFSQKKNLIKSKISILNVYKNKIPIKIKLVMYFQIILLFFLNLFKKS